MIHRAAVNNPFVIATEIKREYRQTLKRVSMPTIRYNDWLISFSAQQKPVKKPLLTKDMLAAKPASSSLTRSSTLEC